MHDLFSSILRMSVTASYVVIIVILMRLLLRNLPKIISYVLWGIVAVRLTVPITFESAISLLPQNIITTPAYIDSVVQEIPNVNSDFNEIDGVVNGTLPEVQKIVSNANSVSTLQTYEEIFMLVWVVGIIVLLLYYALSIIKLKKQLKDSKLVEKKIYIAENLNTPFVMGLLRPRIYLPIGLNEEEKRYIIKHEEVHIERKDYIVKTFAFVLLAIYWFNPIIWIAFVLMNRDMEFSCDERVLKELEGDIKKPYAMSLVNLATEKHFINRIAFGEGDVKGRVKNVLNYRKRNFWLVGSVVVMVTFVGIGLIVNPVKADDTTSIDISDDVILENLDSSENEEIETKEVKNFKRNVLVGEDVNNLGLFKFGMSSDDVFDLVSTSDSKLVLNTTEEGTFDDKYLREMTELDSNAEVAYEYIISENLHLYFDSEKLLRCVLLGHNFPVRTYDDVIEYYEENQSNIFYSGELSTEKKLSLLSTRDELLELYGEPDVLEETDRGDFYTYKLDNDLYMTVIIIGREDERFAPTGAKDPSPFVYRISYTEEEPLY